MIRFGVIFLGMDELLYKWPAFSIQLLNVVTRHEIVSKSSKFRPFEQLLLFFTGKIHPASLSRCLIWDVICIMIGFKIPMMLLLLLVPNEPISAIVMKSVLGCLLVHHDMGTFILWLHEPIHRYSCLLYEIDMWTSTIYM